MSVINAALIFALSFQRFLLAIAFELRFTTRHRSVRLPREWQMRSSFSHPTMLQGPLYLLKESEGCKEEISAASNIPDDKILTFEALDHFLEVKTEINQEFPEGIEIVSRGQSNTKKNRAIETCLFAGSNNCFVVIMAKGIEVSLSSLKTATSDSNLRLIEEDEESIQLCGFPTNSIPPFGHLSKHIKVVMDEDLLLSCQSENLLLLGNGGTPYWQCLVSCEVMVSLRNILIASLSRYETFDNSTTRQTQHSSSSQSTNSRVAWKRQEEPRPFTATMLPPMYVARLVVDQRELSNPLVPQLVKIEGLVGDVNRSGKRNADVELFPSLPSKDEGPTKSILPWVENENVSITVQLRFGKPLVQKFGATQAEIAIDRLQPGVQIEAVARTNVADRHALAVFLQNQVLSLIVSDFFFISDEFSGETNYSSMKQTKHRPKSHTTDLSLPSLALSDLFDHDVTVEVVDCSQSILSLSNDFTTLNSMHRGSMIGIDCEWQPHQLASPGEKRPTLLLQLSFHAMNKVYLVDLHSIVRPLLEAEESQNDIENDLSNILGAIWSSKQILKVGYQLTTDLRRIAASYPHMKCFRQVEGVVELDKLVKRILHLSKHKKSRSITMSLARMTSHYLGKTVDKGCQVSDWQARPLTESQKEYAALDAAVAVPLLVKALSTIDSNLNPQIPRFQRWQGDDGLSMLIESARYTMSFTKPIKHKKKSQPKQIVGDHWVSTQTWITEEHLPVDNATETVAQI